MKRPHKSAFTLIELLVVIAIIALLAAILIPAITNARRKADSGLCKTNLRTMAQSVHSYATDHEDWLPPGPPGTVLNSSGQPYTNGLRRSMRAMYASAKFAGNGNSIHQISYHTAPYLDLPRPEGSSGYQDCPPMRCMGAWKKSDKVLQTRTNFINYTVNNNTVSGLSGAAFGSSSANGPCSQKLTAINDAVGTSRWWMMTDGDNQNVDTTAAPGSGHLPRWDYLEEPAHDNHRNIVYFDSHVAQVPVTTVSGYVDVNQPNYGKTPP